MINSKHKSKVFRRDFIQKNMFKSHSSSSNNSLRIQPVVLMSIVVNLQADEIGGHYLAQMQHGGCPLSAFKFPPRVHFPPQSIIKVWAMSADPGCCKPPADYVFKQLLRWCVGADISTILCRPNGQVRIMNAIQPAIHTNLVPLCNLDTDIIFEEIMVYKIKTMILIFLNSMERKCHFSVICIILPLVIIHLFQLQFATM